MALENIRSERATAGRKYKETFSVDTFSSFCPPEEHHKEENIE